MTSTTLYASAHAIRAEARQLDPVKVLLTLVLLVPFVIGWTLRIVWVAVALLWTGAVHGWRVASQRVEGVPVDPRSG